MIAFDGVTKRFGAVVALDDVSLSIAAGEFFCLLGPSGCGKSTLLRILAGFEVPDAGQVRLDGDNLGALPPHRRPLNMMFQSYALFPHLTVAQNVGYGLRWLSLRREERRERVAEMLRMVRLEDVAARYPAQVSGGQSQRAALARALARRPRVLLLDEPLGALDRRLREDTQGELKALQAQLGTTFVMVTHDQSEAMTMADRIAVLDRGRIAQVGTPRDVYKRPDSRFVAGFLGDVNLFDGIVAEIDGVVVKVRITAAATTLLATAPSRPLVVGSAITVAVRPEAVRIVSGADGEAGANAVDGTVVERGFLGHATFLRVRLAGGEMVRVQLGEAPDGSEGHPAPGDPVRLGIPPAAATILTR